METRTIGGTERDFAVTLDAKPFRQFEAWLDNRGDQPTLWPTETSLHLSLVDTRLGINLHE